MCIRDRRNAVDYAMWLELARLAAELGADPDVRVLVVRGVGEHFCAGGDISGLGDLPFEEYTRANELADRALADFPKPVSYTHLDVYKRQAPW